MPMFNFSQEELLTFFAVLVRYSVLISVLPFLGDRFVPTPVKVLFSLALTVALFPALVSSGQVKPGEALGWGSSAGGLLGTIALEAMFGLVLGFTARMIFDALNFGANLAGTFMGFAAASMYDPHQESQTQVVAEFQMAIAMLIFLAIDGHHMMLRATLSSYQIVGLGKAEFGAALSQRLVDLSGQVMKFGIQIAAPVAVCLFGVNVAFGIVAKAMPNLNVLVLSFAVTALVGMVVLLLSLPEYAAVAGGVLGRMEEWMELTKQALATR